MLPDCWLYVEQVFQWLRQVDYLPQNPFAEQCFDKYRLESDPNCDAALREDLEALAQHFVDLSTLQSVFIESLVPWSEFVRPYNIGHAAIADFLITRAAVAGISQ